MWLKKLKSKPYKIVGFYDSETNNVEDLIKGHCAFPILHQLGLINRADLLLKDITLDNIYDVIDIKLCRHVSELCLMLDAIPELFSSENIVPVIAVHNLGFDMYALSDWLATKEVRVLAKSSTKPISFTILDENGNAELVLWDTLQFSGKSLERMGADCGLPKLKGSWDYNLQRTPETPLTDEEIAYAKQDIYTLAAWLGFWARNNPEIDEAKLGLNIVTKTGVVRAKRTILFDQIKGNGNKYNIGRFWNYHNKREQPKSDDELFTMQACTRGGFTFCASTHASKVYDLSDKEIITGYDATSMHPSQMVSHAYPYAFHNVSPKVLNYAATTIRCTSLNEILTNWYKPFPVAFNACFEFTNLRPKENSLYKTHGIYPLAWARVSEIKEAVNEDNEAQSMFMEKMHELGYKDSATEAVYNFGKLVSAKSATLYLTELAYWELCQAYEFDDVKSIHGYLTNRFCKPTDMSVISVMHFYTAKRVFKDALLEYEHKGKITNKDELAKYAPIGLVTEMANGTASLNDVKLQMQNIKADLNALYGVECTNEYRDDTILTEYGIGYKGELGLVNAPKNPKSWYQFGQRIVGWSRIMQHAAMQLVEPFITSIVCGDTDSLKLHTTIDKLADIDKALTKISNALDKGKRITCYRVKKSYPDYYDSLDGIGYYVKEFEEKQFCASWNKAYVIRNERGYSFTIAGITTNRRYVSADETVFNNSYNDLASYLEETENYSFADVCNLLLGYNLLIDSSITKINGRKAPMWASNIFERYTDYLGNETLVSEPASLALFNMPKLIGGQDSLENNYNLKIALKNNSDVNKKYRLIRWIAGDKPAIIDL